MFRSLILKSLMLDNVQFKYEHSNVKYLNIFLYKAEFICINNKFFVA